MNKIMEYMLIAVIVGIIMVTLLIAGTLLLPVFVLGCGTLAVAWVVTRFSSLFSVGAKRRRKEREEG
jgi:hypothetical protein